MLRSCVCLRRHWKSRVVAIATVLILATVIIGVLLSTSSSSESNARVSVAARVEGFETAIEPLIKHEETIDADVNVIRNLAETESEGGRELKREPAIEQATIAKHTELNSKQSLQTHRNLKEAPARHLTTTNTSKSDTDQSFDCSWVNATYQPPYFLTALLTYRIYEDDKAKLTTKELKQWLEYMRYIGVEHVYAYDSYYTQDENQKTALARYTADGYITLIDWSMYNPYTLKGTKLTAYADCKKKFETETDWQTAIDIDEYPYSSVDTEPGFLYRYMKKYSRANPTVSEISMENYLYLGKPLDRELLMERLWRHTHGPANKLVKPIYKLANVKLLVRTFLHIKSQGLGTKELHESVHVFVLSCKFLRINKQSQCSVYVAQKHACFHVNFPFSA